MPAKPKALTFPQKIQAAQSRVGGLTKLCHVLFGRGITISHTSLWRWSKGTQEAHVNHVIVIEKELDLILKDK